MRELGVHKIEVHVAGVCICYRADTGLSVLALRRAATKQLFPSRWEGIGGQVLAGESLEEAVQRHLRDEAGLDGSVLMPVCTYVIEPGADSGAAYRIPGIRFIVLVDGSPPRLDPAQHSAWRWLAERELDDVDWIPGLGGQIQLCLNRMAGA